MENNFKHYLDITNKDCGLFHCPVEHVKDWCGNTFKIIQSCETQLKKSQYTVDIKVHMLMPGQFPCIPNWHFDMVPRDKNGEQDFEAIDDNLKMYLWLSGSPLTEFEDGRKINPLEWACFTQNDKHRGVPSKSHSWRMFIRLVPTKVLPIAPPEKWSRRHSQVYLDSNNFRW